MILATFTATDPYKGEKLVSRPIFKVFALQYSETPLIYPLPQIYTLFGPGENYFPEFPYLLCFRTGQMWDFLMKTRYKVASFLVL